MSDLGISGISGTSAGYSSPISNSAVSGPDWEKIPYKGMERSTEEEFNVIIDELAKGLAQANYNNNDSEYKSIRSMVEKVKAQYISIVSPDRKSMAKEALQLMKQSRSDSHKKVADEPKILFDYLNMADGLGEYAKEGRWSATSSSGTTVVLTGSDLEPDMFEIKENPLGQEVLGYSAGQWSYTCTPQEQVMRQAFLSRLNTAEYQYYYQYLDWGIPTDSQEKNSATLARSADSFDLLV